MSTLTKQLNNESLIVGLKRHCEELAARIKDYEEVLADHKRLVRELDVALNGIDGSAKQASLCDIVAQVKSATWLEQSHREWMSHLPVVGYWFPCKNANGSVLRAAYLAHEGYEPLYALPVKE